MRKDQLIASVQKLILKQSPTQDSLKFAHPKVIEGEIAKAYSSMMIQFYANNVNLMNAELDFYAKKYTETIKTDVDKFFYIDLPSSPISLKNNLGIRYVRPVAGLTNFIRVMESEMENIRKLPIYCCLADAYYYMDGSRIVFDFPLPEHRMIEQVYIKLLPGFGAFDDADNISFPGGDDIGMKMILELMGFRPTDNVNDDVR